MLQVRPSLFLLFLSLCALILYTLPLSVQKRTAVDGLLIVL